jgi:two-component system OmpR family response regulator
MVGVSIVVASVDERQSRLLCEFFQSKEVRVVAVQSLEQISAEIPESRHGCLILDRQFSGGEMLTWLESMRRQGQITPCVVISDFGGTSQVLGAFRAGADDFLVKPLDLDEVYVRVEALVRRVNFCEGGRWLSSFAGVTVCRLTRGVRVDGKSCCFSSRKFDLLAYFIANQGRLVTRKEIAVNVWGSQIAESTNVIEVAVHKLRDKFDRLNHPLPLHSVRGKGYVLGAIDSVRVRESGSQGVRESGSQGFSNSQNSLRSGDL